MKKDQVKKLKLRMEIELGSGHYEIRFLFEGFDV
jgi:hypothetical protein